jgi:hypothetical protein
MEEVEVVLQPMEVAAAVHRGVVVELSNPAAAAVEMEVLQ